MNELSLKGIVFAMVEAVDLVNFLLKNHHKRVAIITNALCLEMKLDDDTRRRAVLAAALHDVGALYVKERDELIHLDIENPHPHAIRGSILLAEFNFFEEISNIVLHHHRSWQFGQGETFMGKSVPLEAFIIHLADRIDILLDPSKSYFLQKEKIITEINQRLGEVFEPHCVEAFNELAEKEVFWLRIESIKFEELLHQVFESKEDVEIDYTSLERIATLFSNIVDSRSPYTASHSKAVGEVAYELCKLCNIDDESCEKVRIAGLLHDLGKIAIPNEIVEKESKLSESEYQIMKSHAYFTYQILSNIKGLEEICNWASMHHEKKDGSGYPFHLKQGEISLEMEVLNIADVFTALSENRPYREGLTKENILEYLNKELSHLDGSLVLETLKENMKDLNGKRFKIQQNAYSQYNENLKKISELTDLLRAKKTEEKPQK